MKDPVGTGDPENRVGEEAILCVGMPAGTPHQILLA